MTTLHTSAESLRAISNKGMAAKQKEVFDIVLILQKRGQADVSGKEIAKFAWDEYGRHLDQVSARVCELLAAKRLIRSEVSRLCTVSKKSVHPLFVPATQDRMFY
jgi:hypothetical protein